ncbi:MAG: hypothetical protein ACEY3H_02615 [Wolbachia sp.]
MPLTTLYNATYSTFNTYGQRPYDVIPVLDTGIPKKDDIIRVADTGIQKT